MSKKIKLIGASLLLLSLAAAHGALAVEPVKFTPEITIPGSDFIAYQERAVGDSTKMICDYIIAIYKYAIAIVGIFAVVAIAIGGAIWVLSGGSGARVTEGKSWVIGGLLGLLLALGSFILLASISDEFVTCTLSPVRQIAYKQQATSSTAGLDFGTNYGIQGQRCQEPARSLDSSGNFYCCVIYGDIDKSGLLWDTAVKRCSTYEAANRQAAQDECNNFYKTKFPGNEKNAAVYAAQFYGTTPLAIVPVVGLPLMLYFKADAVYQQGKSLLGHGDSGLSLEPIEPSTSPADPDNQNKNTAEVYKGRCWEIPKIKKWCMGSDCPEYCKAKGDFSMCVTPAGEWGYCLSNACHKCKKHCEACDDNRECPNQTKRPDTDAGVICGEEIFHWWSADSSDCNSGFCAKTFDGGCK